MKKIYSAPDIVFESFAPCTSIAAGCEIIIEGPSAGTCGYAYEGGGGATMFTELAGISVCNIPVDDDEANGFCYHVPIDTNNLFNS